MLNKFRKNRTIATPVVKSKMTIEDFKEKGLDTVRNFTVECWDWENWTMEQGFKEYRVEYSCNVIEEDYKKIGKNLANKFARENKTQLRYSICSLNLSTNGQVGIDYIVFCSNKLSKDYSKNK